MTDSEAVSFFELRMWTGGRTPVTANRTKSRVSPTDPRESTQRPETYWRPRTSTSLKSHASTPRENAPAPARRTTKVPDPLGIALIVSVPLIFALWYIARLIMALDGGH